MVVFDDKRRPRLRDGREAPGIADAWDSWRGHVLVPKGHLWVEGDAVGRSADSHWVGPVSRALLIGRAVAVIWPWRRFGASLEKGGGVADGGTRVVRAAGWEVVRAGSWGDAEVPVELAEMVDPARVLETVMR